MTSAPVSELPSAANSLTTRHWTAAVGLNLPNPSRYRLHPTVEEAIPDLFAGLAPVLGVGPAGLRIGFHLEAPTSTSAYARAEQLAIKVAELIGLDATAVSAISIEEVAVPEPEYVGSAEAAELLGVSSQRFQQLRKRLDFPPPLFKLAATPVWLADTIVDYNSRRLAASGQPFDRGLTN